MVDFKFLSGIFWLFFFLRIMNLPLKKLYVLMKNV